MQRRSNHSTDNKIISFISQHLTLFILFPTFLGGCVQFTILSLKSFTLLKYFSANQVLTDGILILVQVPVFLIGIFINLQYNEANNNIKKKRLILILLLAFLIIIAALFVQFFIKQDYNMIGKIGYLVIANLILVGLLYKDKRFLQTFNKKASYVISISIVLSVFYNILNKPNYNEISNISNLTVKINKKYPKAVLIYCNDKYLFFDKYPNGLKTTDKYEIVSTDHLFLEDYNIKVTGK